MKKRRTPLTLEERIHEALLQRYLEGAWISHDSVAIDEHFHPQCVVTGMIADVLDGVAQVRAAHNAMCGRMDHQHCNIHKILIRDDEFSFCVDIEGVHADSGKHVVLEISGHGQFEDSLIYRMHQVIDYRGLFSKLELFDRKKYLTAFG